MISENKSVRFNHVSVPATDFGQSEKFYRDVLDCERIAAPNFGFPVCWLRLGDLQLHLQQIGPKSGVLTYQHFAVTVDDFASVYRALRDRGAFEEGTRYADVWILPSGELQMFARDPAGNLIEVNHPDQSQVDLSVFSRPPRRLADEVEQEPVHCGATLFLPASAEVR
ncbi:MAG: VOC family protein [Rhizobiaceae bacterium]|nr:VOC family protein [Rhizobiaceae bacterium]